MRNAEDDEDERPAPLGRGVTEDREALGETIYAAVLWIPDPTERRGWRDLWIERKPESKPKRLGFGRHP
jgi:hypothetical protein